MQGGPMNQKDMTFNWKVRPQNKIVITVLRPQNFAGGQTTPGDEVEMADVAPAPRPAQRPSENWEFHVESGFAQQQQQAQAQQPRQAARFHHHQADKRSLFASSHSAKSRQYTSMPNMSYSAFGPQTMPQAQPQAQPAQPPQSPQQAPFPQQPQQQQMGQPMQQTQASQPIHLPKLPLHQLQQAQSQAQIQHYQRPTRQRQSRMQAPRLGQAGFAKAPAGQVAAFQQQQTPNPFEKNLSAPGIIEQMRNMHLERVRQEQQPSVVPALSPPSPSRRRAVRKTPSDADSTILGIQGGVKKRRPPRPFEKIPSAPDGLVHNSRPRMLRTNSAKGRGKLGHPGHQATAFQAGAMEVELPTFSEIALDVRKQQSHAASPQRAEAGVFRAASGGQADKMAIASLLAEPMPR